MPVNYLLLEEYLRGASLHHKDQFPIPDKDYFAVYISAKNYIFTHYAAWATAAMSSGEDFYTDHGPKHIESVIKVAGSLLVDDNQQISNITPYECFILLSAILIHDAGNVFSREAHERRAGVILRELAGIYEDSIERNYIAKIARAHGGRVHGSKDTLGQEDLKPQDRYLGHLVRPRALAALVRFADEISEDKTRAINHPDAHIIARGSALFHAYAASINSTHYDKNSKIFNISYTFDISKLKIKYIGPEGTDVFLIDEIFSRLHKMNLERHYCVRYMYDFCRVELIRAQIIIVRENDYGELDEAEKIDLQLGDQGYPNESPPKIESHWSGSELYSKYFPEVVNG